MAKYLIKQIVEATQWTEGPCPMCGYDKMHTFAGYNNCASCGLELNSYAVQWNDGLKEWFLEERFIRMFEQLKEDYDDMGCHWCNGTGLNGGRDNLE